MLLSTNRIFGGTEVLNDIIRDDTEQDSVDVQDALGAVDTNDNNVHVGVCATELGSAVVTPTVEATERNSGEADPTLDATDQAGDESGTKPGDTELHPHEDEESKSETNGTDVSEATPLEVFDSEDFMDGLRNEKLFYQIATDDINIAEAADLSEDDSDADDEDVMEDNDSGPVLVEGVEDIADVQLNETAPEMGRFEMTDDELRALENAGWIVYNEAQSGQLQLEAASDYYNGPWGPTQPTAAYADKPLGLFFYFLPKELRIRIANETNLYRQQSICAVAASRRQKLLARRAKDPRVGVPNLEEIETDLRKFKRIQPHEILHVVALLFEMAVAPIRAGLAKDWSTEEEGAIPRGTFSRFMKRARFEAIMKFQHFNNNEKVARRQTKHGKFGQYYKWSRRLFAEGIDLARSYPLISKKKKKTAGDTLGMAGKAVVRNISKALSGQVMKRLIVTDRYYSSTALILKLLGMDLYHVGTARIDRLGWCPLHFTQAKRPQRMPRGTYRIAQARNHPEMIALSWMDSKPVTMLATGCSTRMNSVQRKEKDGTRATVPCPQLVVDYGLGMGGVDIHDQLRLHRYSIQKCISLRKYYKQLFLCIVDMAVVNGYIVHRHTLKKRGEAPLTHADYLRHLHGQCPYLASSTHSTCVKCARPSPTPRPSRLRPATTAPNAATHSEGACPFVETFAVLRAATHSRARKSGTRLGATARASRQA
ncbi:hypothetical protein ON010_g10564 [Phytophthora cinnamomi]|nr:hypothetical protein ON010_g10564 [Phytophthora cinnamomi]